MKTFGELKVGDYVYVIDSSRTSLRTEKREVLKVKSENGKVLVKLCKDRYPLVIEEKDTIALRGEDFYSDYRQYFIEFNRAKLRVSNRLTSLTSDFNKIKPVSES